MPKAKKKLSTSRKAPAQKRAAPAKKGRGRRANLVTVDFTDVDAGGLMPTPDGIYTVEVRSAEQEVSSNGNDMITCRYRTNIGSTVFDRFMLMPQSLWVLRTALNAMGYDTPDGQFQFDPEDLVGQTMGVEITNEEFEEKDQPRVTGYLAYDVAEAQAESAPVVDDEEEDDDEDADVDDEDEDVDEDEDEDEDEEEEPAPKKAARKKKAAPKKKKSGALRPGARVTFEDEGEDYGGVIEYIEEGMATVVDDEEGEWEIPVDELTKA
jgi:hypothetical protein